jgi:hypothetical protein
VSKRTRAHRPAGTRGPRRLATLADRIASLRRLELGLFDAYETERLHVDHRMQAFAWRVRVNVPVYDESFDLRIELAEGRLVRVVAENWSVPMKHSFGRNELCMWYPRDPADRRWQRDQGLLVLVDTAVTHLFKELYYQETGEWLGEEAPHGLPKTEALDVTRAA